jgi:hypothetical protein
VSDFCLTCGHERTLGRCWRLTCPENGARESFELARPGPFHKDAKKEGRLL